MSSVTEAVGVIRAFLGDISAQPDETVRAAAETYQAAHDQVAHRLRQCMYLLDRELPAEAVHLAEQTPPLLELHRELEFKEAAKWRTQAGINRLPAPADDIPDRDIQRLLVAYLREEKIRPLLARHRRLALAHAGVRERLATLRRMVELDRLTPGWDADLRELENLRAAELKTEVAEALTRRDPAELEALEAELRPDRWKTPPPAGAYESVQEVLDTFEGQRLENEFAKTAEALLQARQNDKPDDARGARRAWDELLLSGRSPGEDLQASVVPVFNWLDQLAVRDNRRKASRQAMQALHTALAEQRPFAELTPLLARAQSLGEVPAPLAAAVQERGRAEQANETQKSQGLKTLLVALAAVVVVGAGVLVFFVVRGQRREEAITDLMTRVKASGNVRDADLIFEDFEIVEPSLWKDERVAYFYEKYLEETAKERAAERERVRRLGEAMTQAGRSLEDGDHPTFLEAAQLAERLVATGEEREAFEALDRRGREWLEAMRTNAAELVGRLIADAEELRSESEEVLAKGDDEALAKLARNIREMREAIRGGLAGAGAYLEPRGREPARLQTLDNGLAETVKTIAKRRAALSGAREHWDLMERAGRDRNIDEYARLLEILDKEARNARRTNLYAEAMRTLPDATAEIAFAGILASLETPVHEQKRDALTKLQALAERFAGRTMRDHEDEARVAVAEEAGWAAKLLDAGKPTSPFAQSVTAFAQYLKRPEVSSIWLVSVGTQGASRQGYTLREPQKDRGKLMAWIIDADGDTQRTEIRQYKSADHVKLAQDAAQALRDFPGDGEWPLALMRCARRILDAPGEPAVTASLAMHMLRIAATVAPSTHAREVDALAKTIQRALAENDFSDKWPRASHKSAIETRAVLARLVKDWAKDAERLEGSIGQGLELHRDLRQRGPLPREWVGMLAVEGNAERCRARLWADVRSDSLYVLLPGGEWANLILDERQGDIAGGVSRAGCTLWRAK